MGIIYKITIKNTDFYYFGKSKRNNLKSRIREHKYKCYTDNINNKSNNKLYSKIKELNINKCDFYNNIEYKIVIKGDDEFLDLFEQAFINLDDINCLNTCNNLNVNDFIINNNECKICNKIYDNKKYLNNHIYNHINKLHL